MIRTFRPWQLFEQLKKLGLSTHLDTEIPTVPGTTSRTVFMLETAILVAAARIVKAERILEIGTCMGYTAMHLAMNTDASIESWDIQRRLQVWEGTRYQGRVNYRVLDISLGQTHDLYPADMVFVDANHDYEWVRRDTELALHTNPRCIAWHDYSNPMEPGVMKFISDFAENHNLIHVQDSWIALWFKEDLP